jgi:hypothetical protein
MPLLDKLFVFFQKSTCGEPVTPSPVRSVSGKMKGTAFTTSGTTGSFRVNHTINVLSHESPGIKELPLELAPL